MTAKIHFNQGLSALPPEGRWITRWPHNRPLCNRYAASVHNNQTSRPATSKAKEDVTCRRCLNMLEMPEHAWRSRRPGGDVYSRLSLTRHLDVN